MMLNSVLYVFVDFFVFIDLYMSMSRNVKIPGEILCSVNNDNFKYPAVFVNDMDQSNILLSSH